MCLLQSVWTGWNEETAKLEHAKFSSMRRQKGYNTEWTVQQTALNISQTVRMMKVAAARENQKWNEDYFTTFHAWTLMSVQEVMSLPDSLCIFSMNFGLESSQYVSPCESVAFVMTPGQ